MCVLDDDNDVCYYHSLTLSPIPMPSVCLCVCERIPEEEKKPRK